MPLSGIAAPMAPAAVAAAIIAAFVAGLVDSVDAVPSIAAMLAHVLPSVALFHNHFIALISEPPKYAKQNNLAK